jgi:SAM-dependent methyltransferase
MPANSLLSLSGAVSVSVDVSLKPKRAFETFAHELSLGLRSRGLKVDTFSRGGKITEADAEVGVIEGWSPGRRITLLWHPKSWEPGTASKIVVRFSAKGGRTRVTLESRGWGGVLGGDAGELLGWFAGEVAAHLLSASAPNRLGDWIIDRGARRPSGEASRETYGNPVYHWPNFFAILDVLKLGPDDNLVEVGCGGGAFLHEALKSGCRASAIDHSADMVQLATEVNFASVERKQLKVSLGDASGLPYPSGTFTCAVMTGVIHFLPDPGRVFREVFRVLRREGRFVVFTGSKEIKGTPAAPEPGASRLRFYDDAELEALAQQAGFDKAEVKHPSLHEYAKKAGVPEADLEFFEKSSAFQLLVCRKA